MIKYPGKMLLERGGRPGGEVDTPHSGAPAGATSEARAAFSEWDAHLAGRLMSHPSLTGIRVSPQSALTFAAAFACINVLSTDVAVLPTRVMRRNDDGTRHIAKENRADRLLSWSPDGVRTPFSFRQAAMVHALGWGNSYTRIHWSGGGEPEQLELLSPTTYPDRDRSKRLWYIPPEGPALKPRDVIHVAGLSLDGLKGLHQVNLHNDAIGLGKAAEGFGSAFFGNGATPGGVIEVPQEMSDDAYKRLDKAFEQKHGGFARAMRTAILEGGATWKSTSIAPEIAQFLETRRFQALEMCRVYRVPPHKIADFGEAHLANIEASNLDYAMTGLVPWLVAWEQSFNLKLFPPDSPYYVKHNLNAMLRGDMKSRGEFYTKLRDLGVVRPNDIREWEDMDPIPEKDGGNVLLVPLNMQVLAHAGQYPHAAINPVRA